MAPGSVAIALVTLAGWLLVKPALVTGVAHAATVPAALVAKVDGDPGTPVSGNPVGTITVAEFFDYRCPYCRMMQPTLEALVAHDRRVRLVSKEWPIFGGISIYAARVALASQWQGKYAAVHKALFSLPRTMDEAAVRAAAAEVRVDMTRLDQDLTTRYADLDAILARTAAEAHAVDFQGDARLRGGVPCGSRRADCRGPAESCQSGRRTMITAEPKGAARYG